MFCGNCGTQIAEGRRFCGSCGAPLRAAAASDAAAGTATAAAAPPPVSVAATPVKVRAPWSPAKKIIVGVLALIVAATAGAGWWWFHRPAPAYHVQDPGIYPFRTPTADGKIGKWGFIDADGKVLIQPEWDEYAAGSVLGQPIAFSEGLCGVLKGGKWGYIDTGGRLVIPNQFDSAGSFIGGLAVVVLGNKDGYIDKTGHYAINPQFDQASHFHEGLAAVLSAGLWGFINRAGVYAIKPRFQAADHDGFSDGLAGACLGQCGYIDSNGTFAIRPQFDSESTFSESLAAVQINNKWGYINTSGNIVINPQFDAATMFSGGLAVVSVSGNQGVINKAGKYVVNPGQYNIQPREGDLQPVTTSDGMGLISRDGKWVVKPSKALTGIPVIYGKVFIGTIGGQLVPISTSGKVLAGWYKGAMLDTLAEDLPNEASALNSMMALVNAETSYSNTFPTVGFASSLIALGPATNGNPDEKHAGLIAAALATGAENNYQFSLTIPPGTATGGTNFNYQLTATPFPGHAGRIFCADSTGKIRYAILGESCTASSPVIPSS